MDITSVPALLHQCIMRDIEAQLDENVRGAATHVQSIDIPLQKLSDLVELLTRSVQILQSINVTKDQVISNNDYHEIAYQASDALETVLNEANNTAMDLNQKEEDGGRIDKLTAEEIARWNEERVHEFNTWSDYNDLDSSLSSNADSWVVLRQLNWPLSPPLATFRELSANQLAEPRFIPAIIRALSEDPKARKLLQKRIYLALSRRRWSTFQGRGVLDMGPWVSLIGMRLSGFPDQSISTVFNRLQLLAVLLETPYVLIKSGQSLLVHERTLWEENLTVGMVLDQCYQRGVFELPPSQDLDSCQRQVHELAQVLRYINLWQRKYVHRHLDATSVEEIRNMTLAELWSFSERYKDKHYDEEGLHTEAEGGTFRRQDMSLETLQKIGKLKFQWTEFIEEHLSLNTENRTLKIFWFGFAVKHSPVFRLGCQSMPAGIDDELASTYSLLFRSRKSTYKENLAQYGLLPIPQWLRVFHGTEKGALGNQTAKDMSYFLQPNRPQVSDIRYHIADLDTKLPSTQPFRKYPKFEDRLRRIKGYMDGQKPSGIRGLWADKRDSSQWFTFWAVIIIGSMSIVLACLGLAVSIVQTIGTFKGLE